MGKMKERFLEEQQRQALSLSSDEDYQYECYMKQQEKKMFLELFKTARELYDMLYKKATVSTVTKEDLITMDEANSVIKRAMYFMMPDPVPPAAYEGEATNIVAEAVDRDV